MGFDFAPLFTIHRVLAAPKGHPVTDQREISYSTLARWPLVMLSAASRTRILLDDAFRKRGISYDLAVETDSLEAIKQYVAGGVGISILLDIALSVGDGADLAILPLSNLMPADLVLGCHPERETDFASRPKLHRGAWQLGGQGGSGGVGTRLLMEWWVWPPLAPSTLNHLISNLKVRYYTHERSGIHKEGKKVCKGSRSFILL